jgi:carbamoyltransferase
MKACFWRRQVFGYHAEIGWWHCPNLRARIPLGQTFHTVVTNSIGMRASREYPKARPRGRKRLLFLGDSYTAGDGVSNEQRFTDLLEARWRDLDALNFGLNGSGTDQQVLIFERLARAFEVDAYVFCVCVENIARNMYSCFPSWDWREQTVAYRPKPWFELVGDELVLKNQPVPRARRLKEQLGDWRYEFPVVAGDPDRYAVYKQTDGPHWRLMKRLFRRFLEQVRGAPVLLVPLPMVDHYLETAPSTYWPRFQELEDPASRVFVVDVLSAFKAVPRAERERFRFPDDPHYTPRAHALVADVLARELERRVPEAFS